MKNWYGFKISCDLYNFGQSNMIAPSKQEWCMRVGRDGKKRPKHSPFHCSKNVCPYLKGKLKMNEHQKNCMERGW